MSTSYQYMYDLLGALDCLPWQCSSTEEMVGRRILREEFGGAGNRKVCITL